MPEHTLPRGIDPAGTRCSTTRARPPASTRSTPTRPPLALRISPDETADRVERQVERFAPGFRDTVIGRQVRSPERMEQHNPSMVGGDLARGGVHGTQGLAAAEFVLERTR